MFWLSPSAYWPCDCLKNHFLYITSCIKNGLFVKRTRDSSVSTFIKDKQFNMLNTKTFSVSLSQESHLLKLPRRMGEGGGNKQTNIFFWIINILVHSCHMQPAIWLVLQRSQHSPDTKKSQMQTLALPQMGHATLSASLALSASFSLSVEWRQCSQFCTVRRIR